MRMCLLVVAVLAVAPACKKNEETAAAPPTGSAGSGSGSGSAASAPLPPVDAAVAIAADAAATGPAPIDAEKLLEIESIGPLTFGMSGTAATKVLGVTKQTSPPVEEGATGEFISTWSWPGIDLEMAGEKRTGPVRVRLITIEAPSTYATKRGIKIGSSLADVARAYPKSDEGSDDPTLFLVGSPYGGMLFETKGDVVVKILLGPMAF